MRWSFNVHTVLLRKVEIEISLILSKTYFFFYYLQNGDQIYIT